MISIEINTEYFVNGKIGEKHQKPTSNVGFDFCFNFLDNYTSTIIRKPTIKLDITVQNNKALLPN
jgi:hypothetical protein